jgi:very-short-patch-repair endonuclease
MPSVKHPSPLIPNARSNRRQMNEGEVRIWAELRRRSVGVRFRRQHPIGPYIVDFACLTLKLIIEIDGSQHHDALMADAVRDHYLTARGWTVLRFSSHDAVANTPLVVETILNTIYQLSG